MIMRWSALVVLLACVGCYRETAFQEFAVTATETTDNNDERLSVGTDSSGRRLDYVLQNSNLQAVINGNLNDPSRDLFLPKSAGALVDLSTRFRESGSRDVVSRDDDGVNQISQGVNLSRHNVISYDDIQIRQDTETEARLVLSGGVFDLDGSMEAAGASVDPVTRRVRNCLVNTTYSLQETITAASAEEDDLPVLYLTVTTVITNTGGGSLPIFTVNDIMVTTIGGSNIFIPYPDWGFNIPSEESIAYPLYVHLLPVQVDTAHYGMTSLMDGVVSARREQDRDAFADFTFIGKARTPDNDLPGGEALTYMRDFIVYNEGTSFSSNIRSIQGYREFAKIMKRNAPEGNPWRRTGGLGFQTNSPDFPGGTLVVSYTADVEYFDGNAFVPLEEGRVYPWMGDRPIDSNYSFFEGTVSDRNFLIPTGRITIDAQALNSEPVNVSFRVDTDSDNPGTTIQTPIEVPLDDEFLLGSIDLGTQHSFVNFGFTDDNSRSLMARLTFSRLNDDPVEMGQFPRNAQGPFFYVNSVIPQNAVNNNGLVQEVRVADGNYDLFVTRGPLYEARILELTALREQFDPTNPIGFALSLDQEFTTTNMWSADFGLRSNGDPLSFSSLNQLFRLAYAEDLDVAFFGDTNHTDNAREFYRAIAATLGAFDAQDFNDDIDSLFDEVAYSRAAATIGKVAGEFPDRGRFTLHNLPDEDELPTLQTLLMETDPAEFYDRLRATFPEIVIHVTRPRAPVGFETGLFTVLAQQAGLAEGTPLPGDATPYFQTATTGSATRWIDFDAMQLLSGNEYEDYLLARQDWFNLLNAGIYKPVTGGSLVGQTRNLPVGTVRTWVGVTDTTKRDNDLKEFWESVRAGNMMISNGPLIEASIGSASFGETAQTSSASVTVDLKIEAASWIPVREVRAVINGVPQVLDIQLNRGQSDRFEGQVTLDLPTDRTNHWIVIEAGASLEEIETGSGLTGIYGLIYPEHVPIAFTNPIFINGGN